MNKITHTRAKARDSVRPSMQARLYFMPGAEVKRRLERQRRVNKWYQSNCEMIGDRLWRREGTDERAKAHSRARKAFDGSKDRATD